LLQSKECREYSLLDRHAQRCIHEVGMSANRSGLVEGKVAVITGGASAIGRAIALRFAEEGARAVVVADLQKEPREGGTPTHELIQQMGVDATFVPTNVTQLADLQATIDAAEVFGGVDVLVNNAGLMRSGRLVNFTEADYDAVMDVNVKGVYFASQAAVRSMKDANRRGVIINLSSIGGLHGKPGISAYCAAKGAVRLLSYALAQELGRYGIRVCALHPGVIDTSMTRVDLPVHEADRGIPVGRLGTPDDIADAAAFLASDRASFVTGASLTVDGGELAIG
jgi:NAD(P)-dependent dehydrogenase (short-subunit alcohol dehydrogenase family)